MKHRSKKYPPLTKVTAVRKTHKMSLKILGKICGRTHGAMSQYLNGFKPIPLEVAEGIIAAFPGKVCVTDIYPSLHTPPTTRRSTKRQDVSRGA